MTGSGSIAGARFTRSFLTSQAYVRRFGRTTISRLAAPGYSTPPTFSARWGAGSTRMKMSTVARLHRTKHNSQSPERSARNDALSADVFAYDLMNPRWENSVWTWQGRENTGHPR